MATTEETKVADASAEIRSDIPTDSAAAAAADAVPILPNTGAKSSHSSSPKASVEKASNGKEAPRVEREFVDPGVMAGFRSKRDLDFACLLLALDNHFNFATTVQTIYRAVMFATQNAQRLVIEVDPFMMAQLPEGVEFEHGKPINHKSPEVAAACEKMIVACTTYIASGGTMIGPDAYKGCWTAVYPEFLTSSSNGTTPKQDKILKDNMASLNKLEAAVEAMKGEQSVFNDRIDQDLSRALHAEEIAENKAKDSSNGTAEPEEEHKFLTAEEKERIEVLPKLIESDTMSIEKLEKENKKIMDKRMKYIEDARDQLNFFSWFNVEKRDKETFKRDSLYNSNEHLLYSYGFLGACMDLEQVAIELIYHGEIGIDEKTPLDPLAFFDAWQKQRRDTMNKIVGANVKSKEKDAKPAPSVLTTIPRKTSRLHFWFSASLLSEFISKIFSLRATFMQNRVMNRYQNLQNEVDAPVVKPKDE